MSLNIIDRYDVLQVATTAAIAYGIPSLAGLMNPLIPIAMAVAKVALSKLPKTTDKTFAEDHPFRARLIPCIKIIAEVALVALARPYYGLSRALVAYAVASLGCTLANLRLDTKPLYV